MERPSFYHMGQIRALERVVQILITSSSPQVRTGIYDTLKSVTPPDDITGTGDDLLDGFFNLKAENRAYQNGFAETLQQIQKQVTRNP